MAKTFDSTVANTEQKESTKGTSSSEELPRIQKILNSPPESSEHTKDPGILQNTDTDPAIELLQHFRSQNVDPAAGDRAREGSLGSEHSGDVLPVHAISHPGPHMIVQVGQHQSLQSGTPSLPQHTLAGTQSGMQPGPAGMPQISHTMLGQIPRPISSQVQYLPQNIPPQPMQYGYNNALPDRFKDIRDVSFHIYSLTCTQNPSPEVIMNCIDHLLQIRRQIFPANPVYSPQFGSAYANPVGGHHHGFRPQGAPLWDPMVGSVEQTPKQQRRKRSRGKDSVQCHECGTQETPEWRRGPDGARTLCNACGLYHAKIAKKQGDEHATQKLRERRLRTRT